MRYFKKKLIILITLLYSISTFASVVDYNDGAAFVTKAEFEQLKASFDEQINRYNLSLDNKINGAISDYILGIKVIRKEKRKKLVRGTDHWLMYNTNDYPQYVDGKPYVAGFTSQGNASLNTSGGQDTVIYVGIKHNGNSTYATNGGFKKHIIGKPSKNATKNGNDLYVAEWQGYYKNESELLTLNSFVSDINSSVWAAKQQDRIRYMNVTSFQNNNCPVAVGDIRFSNDTGSYWTGLTIKCIAAQRKEGEIVGDRYVSIYKNISDNRFWDSTVTNKMGITPTTPAITYTASGNTFKTWMENVITSNEINWSCSNRKYSGGYWYVNEADGCFAKTITTTTIVVNNTSYNHYLLKMANDPNNLQFVRLWSEVTDTVAQGLNDKYEDYQTSTAEKSQIKSALLWDEDGVPHLSMGAGFPFLEVEYDEKVDFEFKIKETGNYRVYAKYGPFSPTGNAASEADVVFEITSGATTTTSTTLPVTGGETTKMKFDVTKDGKNYIFLKWCDTTTNYGGTMDLTEDPIVTPVL